MTAPLRNDSDRYKELQTLLANLLHTGQKDTHEFKTAWQESEAIKNRNGGMPPAEPCPTCGGEGGLDSGGVTPWGSPISIPCPSCSAK